MAEIRVNKVAIPVPALVQKIRTGIFSPDLLGEFSYPFTFPNTEEIALALGLPSDPQSGSDFGEPIAAELYVRGNRRYRGHLDIMEADADDIKAVFVLASGFFIQDNAGLSLQACYDPEDTVPINPDVEYVGGYRLKTAHGDSRLTVNGNVLNMVKEDYEDQEQQLWAVHDWLVALDIGLIVTIWLSDEGHSSSSYVDYWDTTTPTTAELVQMPNGGINRSYIATSKNAARLLMGAFNIPDDANRIAFPMIYNPGLYEGANPIFDGVVNRYDFLGRLDSYNPKYYSWTGAMQWQNTIIPMVYLTDVVRAIFAHLGIRLSGEFLDDPMIRKILLYNNRTLDKITITSGAVSVRRTRSNTDGGDDDPVQEILIYQNTLDFDIRPGRHVPDINVLDFIKALKNTFFLKFDFNLLQNAVEIRFVRNIVRSREVLDLTAKASRTYLITHGKETGLSFSYQSSDPIREKGRETKPEAQYTVQRYEDLDGLDAEIDEYAYVQTLSATYRLTKERDDPATWEVYAFDTQDDPEKEGATGWPLGLTPLQDALYDGRKLPAIEMSAYSPEANIFNKDIGLRFTAFYGQQADAQGRTYAFASANKYTAAENLDNTQHSLYVRDTDMSPLWKDLDRILTRSHRYRTQVLLTEADIHTLTRTRLIRIGNVTYLMDEQELAISDKEASPSRIDLYKLKT